ncbi:LL-diaminopimelate aminotransferase [Lederbergia sp. NSJ-179]|uniref:LL-diaminopimelate aminotransferase n=1 Tax=Lederbergia sp. NSJ-179 TaxID=2931402 RepID=UPI001FD390B3|nr:LL-diaminopimelate aminotransferase [Lederbergia sp. NSJ-179]MCJ7842052.1 LL-diaminopimelate aminotransferase [Lederbergia sp. NSJ-179]
MTVEYIQRQFANRIGGAKFGMEEEIYKFEKIKRAKQEAMMTYPSKELIDLGVGEPDEMADEMVVQVLAEAAGRPENRFYADNGVPMFKEAAAEYMEQVFGVAGLDPETEIIHTIGLKTALAMLPAAFINPGDITLMPSPCYPVLGTFTQYYGGEVIDLPLVEENGFLPQFNKLDVESLKKAKLIYLNYPNNPTGAVATTAFFEEVVAFAKEHELIVIHDAAYAALVYDGETPLSFLSIPGAKEVGIELHSLSKSFNMTGWRMGFVAGNTKLVKAFATVKDNQDSGQFIAIQKAAAYALRHPEITKRTADKYARRFQLLVDALRECGFEVSKPKGSFFLYVKIPKRVENGETFQTAEDFSQYLLKNHVISAVPWDESGHYIRFSVTFQAEGVGEEKRVMGEMKRRLSTVDFIF